MKIITAYQTKNDCYNIAQEMIPAGIIVHSTGANNPNLNRYVDCPEELGKPSSRNWNQPGKKAMVHAFIGKDKNGNVVVVNTLPYNYCAWGVGKGENGSYNYDPAYIQFEICEDSLKDEKYYTEAFKVAEEYCAMLCKEYNLPLENVISHAEAYKRGYGSNHRDCGHWQANFGDNMDDFRKQVDKILNPETVIYRVQVGAYGKEANAQKMLIKLKNAGFNGYVKYDGKYFRVQIGAYSKYENAVKMQNKLIDAGFSAIIK